MNSKDVLLVIKNEWANFFSSDKSVFAVYSIMIVMWSLFVGTNLTAPLEHPHVSTGVVWWVFFAIIVSSNFAHTSVSMERIAGAMEILLTSGLTRLSILQGKIAFVVLISTLFGCICYVFAHSWTMFMNVEPKRILSISTVLLDVGTFFSACVMNACCASWAGGRITNPRLGHFISILFFGLIITIHTLLSYWFFDTTFLLIAILILSGFIFYFCAASDFKSERIIQPVSF